MPKLVYEPKNFRQVSIDRIDYCNTIIGDYRKQGFSLTLRQLFYQLVSRDMIENTQKSYKNLGKLVNDARKAGLIDWHSIEDRTRSLRGLTHWGDPASIIRGAASSYRIDKWANQTNRVEVWIEKDALVGVIQRICNRLDVDYFSCRGFPSQTEVWNAAQRLSNYDSQGQQPTIIHLGDHDPSGIDMTRDLIDRMELFTGGTVGVNRIALNMDQVELYGPPPNPAKTTDSRYISYMDRYGASSWELDALEPSVIESLIEGTVLSLRDQGKWDSMVERENEERKALDLAVKHWSRVSTDLLDGVYESEESNE